MLEELSLSPRLAGRAALPLQAAVGRDLKESDLALLASERGVKPPSLVKIRDRHHVLARALAAGLTPAEASAVTGYSPSRISILSADPSFEELVSAYKAKASDVFSDFVQRAGGLAIEAVQELHDRLEEDPESFTTSDLLQVTKIMADRTGHAPIQRSVNVNANIDLGSRLAQARKRAAEAQEAILIEGTKVP